MATKFWGLVAENGRRYQQKADRGFFITMATLEPVGIGTPSSRYDDKPIHVMVDYDSTSYILCTLWFKEHIIQAPLNIPFGKGEVLEVYIQGGGPKSKVHLTGFYSDTVPAPYISSNERQSILVSSDSKSKENKTKKRVSIQEEVNIKQFEKDEDDDDDDDENVDYDEDDSDDDEDEAGLLSLMNGMGDDDDDEEDDDDDEFDMDEDDDSDEVSEQPTLKGKKNGDVVIEKGKQNAIEGKKKKAADSDDENGSSDEDNELISDLFEDVVPKSPPKNKKLEALKATPESKKNKKPKEMSTPENQGIPAKSPSSAGHTPMKFVAKGGLMIHELKIGNGPPAKQGKMVTVYYSGRLKANNRQFDASTSGPGFKFRLGKGEVIKGWDVGIDGMKVGGKRRLIIPCHMAYGKKGAPPDIPPSSTLVFEVELKNVS